MVAVTPTDIAVNPNDSTQYYVLWGNGRIDSYGGAPAITDRPDWTSVTYQPVAVAIHITDWTTGEGYVLELYGGAHPLNGADALSLSGLGVPYTNPTRRYVDWSWNPDASGELVVLDHYGKLYPANGATAPARTGARWTWPAARKLVMNWTPGNMQAVTMDLYGGLHGDYELASAMNPGGYWPGWDAARDLAVVEWMTAPTVPKLQTLDLYGGIHESGGATEVFGNRTKRGADVARLLVVLSPSDPASYLEVWSNGETFQWTSSSAPTVVAGAGQSEVQTVTITGSPTGGTFQLTFEGQQTGTISRTASAGTVETALEALSNISVGDVTVTGGPGPSTPWVVTFGGDLANTALGEMTATDTFTGGTSPAVSVTTTTDGVTASPGNVVTTTTRPTLAWAYTDAEEDAQAEWEVWVFTQTFADANTMTDPSVHSDDALVNLTGNDSARRGVVADYDFPNGDYRLFVRVQDTSGRWSDWSTRDWTQSVTPPATPTGLNATAQQATYSVGLSVTCTTGGSADTVAFGYSDDGGTTWELVRGAEAVTLETTTTATDWDAPFSVTRQYRAIAYNDDPRVVSAFSGTDSATLTAADYVLTSTDDSSLGGLIRVVDAPTWSRQAKAGVFEGIGAEYPVVVSDGTPKARTGTLGIETDSKADWEMIEALLESDSTLVLRDPFGETVYCRVVGEWVRQQIRRAKDATSTDPGPWRHSHKVSIPLVQVAQPTTLPVTSTVPPGPGD